MQIPFRERTLTMTKTMTNTFREHLQRAIFDTFELWDIWSEWWGDMTWPKKRQWQRQRQRQGQWQRQIHLENTFKEQPQRLVTLETFDQSDEGTWLDQQKGKDKDKDKDNDKDKDILRTRPKSHPRDLWPLRHLFRVMRRHDLTKKYLPTYIPTHLPMYLH